MNPVAGDVQNMNRFNTSFRGATSVNRPPVATNSAIPKPAPTQQPNSNYGGFLQTAQRFLNGFGRR